MTTAIKTLSNWYSMEIRITEDGESVQYRYHSGNESSEWSEEIEILWDLDECGDVVPYFEENGECHYIHEFIRTNI